MESIKEENVKLSREVVTTVPNTWLVEATNPATGQTKMIDIANYAAVVAGVLSPGGGGLFVDKGSVANIDTITESGANKTETLYEGIYTFVANRIILQFRVSPTGVVQVRTNSDWQYLNWRPWKNLTVETPSSET